MNNGHYDFRKPFMSGPWNRRASKREYISFWNGPILDYEFTRADMKTGVTIPQKDLPVLQGKHEQRAQEHHFRDRRQQELGPTFHNSTKGLNEEVFDVGTFSNR